MHYRTGIGYDLHRLIEGRPLVLGGIEVPYTKGLDGHSDADVLLHAICDALLGACAAGDIGEHFPNTDEEFEGISSCILLEKVYTIVSEAGYEIANIDSVVIADEPHLKDFKPQMAARIADILKIDPTAVSVKATTQEGVGKHQAIAAYATVLIVKKET